MHEQTGRLFLCARCQAQVLVCSQCDRGHRYCANGCANITRRSRQREASNRYQQSRTGRHKHAARMHQWRQRRAASAKIVTHHGSQNTPTDAVLPVNESTPALPPDSQSLSLCTSSTSESIVVATTHSVIVAPLWRCHWCQSPCPALMRQGFLRHSKWGRNGCHP